MANSQCKRDSAGEGGRKSRTNNADESCSTSEILFAIDVRKNLILAESAEDSRADNETY